MQIINLKNALILILFIFSILTLKSQNCSINAGIDFSACANETINLEAFTSGSLSTPTGFTWTQISGPTVTIVNPTSFKTRVIGFNRSANNYRFVARIQCGLGGFVYDSLTVTIKSTPLKPNAGNDTSFCTGTRYLNATAPASGETGNWTEYYATYLYNGLNSYSQHNTSLFSQAYGSQSYFSWVLKNTVTGCTDADSIIITHCGGETVNAGPDATADACYQGPSTSYRFGISFTYTNAIPSNAGRFCGQYGYWSLISKPSSAPTPSISNSNDNYNAAASNLYPGSYRFAWNVTGPCYSGSDTMTLVVPNPLGRNPLVAPNTTQYLCGQNSIALLGPSTLLSGQSFIPWSRINGPAGDSIASPNSLSTVVYNLKMPLSNQISYSSPYPYIFRCAIYDSICNRFTYFNRYIYIQLVPTVNFVNNTINLACNATSATATFKYKNVGWNFFIEKVSGPAGSLSYSLSLIDTVTGLLNLNSLSPGTYVYRIRSNQGGCASNIADILTVYVSTPPSLSNAGSNQRLNCNVDSASLIGNIPSIGTGTWSMISGPGSTVILPNSNSNAIKIKNLIAGTYQMRWTINGGTCASNYDDVFVYVAKAPPVSSDAGPNRTVCHSSPIKLQGNSPKSNEYGIWTVSPTGPSFSNNTDSASAVNNLSASTNYKFYWTITNSCGSKTDSVSINTIATAGPVAANAGNNLCLANSTTSFVLKGNKALPSGATSSWTPVGTIPGTILNPTSDSTGVTGMTTGNYYFVYSISVSGCASNTDTVNVTISNAVTTAKAGKDTSICRDTLKLYANIPTLGIGRWSQIAGMNSIIIDSVLNASSTLRQLINGNYTLRWTVSNGACPASFDDIVIQTAIPVSKANAMNDTMYCPAAYSTSNLLRLSAKRPAIGNGRWVFQSGPANVNVSPDTSINPNPFTLGIAGKYTFKWYISGQSTCPSSIDTVVVWNVLSANAGADQNICNQNTAVLTGNNNSDGTWEQIGTLPTVANLIKTSNWQVSVSNLTNGVYFFRYTLGTTGCFKSDTLQLTVNNLVSNFNIGPDTTICLKDTNTLYVSAPTKPVGTTSQWSVLAYPFGYSPQFLNRSDTAKDAIILNANFNGQYLLRYRISNGACIAEDMKIITINESFKANAGKDTGRCSNIDTFLLQGQAVANTSNLWTRYYGASSLPFTKDSLSTKIVCTVNNYTGAYILKQKNLTNRCISRDTVIVMQSKPPTGASYAYTKSVCGNNFWSGINHYTSNNAPGTIFTWSRNNTTNITGIPNTGTGATINSCTPINATSTTQQVIFTVNCLTGPPSNCTGNTFYDTLYVKPNANMNLSVWVDSNQKCFFDTLKLKWNNSNNIVNYCVSSNINCDGDIYYTGLDTQFTHIINQYSKGYYVTATDTGGCMISKLASVSVLDPVDTEDIELKSGKICFNDSEYVYSTTQKFDSYIFSSAPGGNGKIYQTGKLPDFYYKPDTWGVDKWIYCAANYKGKSACPAIDSVSVYIHPSPQIKLKVIPPFVCNGENMECTVVLNDPNNFYGYGDIGIETAPFNTGSILANGADTFYKVNSSDIISATGSSPGDTFSIYAYYFDNNTGCMDTASSVIGIFEIPYVYAGSDKVIMNFYDSAQLGGSPTGACNNCKGGLGYTWYPTDSLNNAYIPNPWTKTDTVLVYYVTVIDSGTLCYATDDIAIVQVLPIEFTSVSANWNNVKPEIKWQVTANNLISYFEVYRSYDGHSFEKISTLNYDFIEENYSLVDSDLPDYVTGTIYYKVIKISNNMAKSESEIVDVFKGEKNLEVEIVPNPVLDNVYIHLNNLLGDLQIKLIDASGKVVQEETLNNLQLKVVYTMELNKNLVSGVYIISINNGKKDLKYKILVSR